MGEVRAVLGEAGSLVRERKSVTPEPDAARTEAAGRGLRRPFRLKLGVLLGVVAALAVMAVAAIGAWFQARDMRADVAQENLRTAGLVASQAEDQVTHLYYELALIAADPTLVADILAGDAARVNERLETVAPFDPDLTGLAVVDLQGRIWANSLRDKLAVGMEVSNQRQVRVPLDDGKPGFGAPMRGPTTGRPVVPFGVPIRDPDGRTIGVLQGNLSLARLSERFNAVRIGERGYASLLTADGIILTNPNADRILTPAAGVNQAVAEARQGRAAAVETVNVSGVPVFAAAVPVPSIGWIVQAQVPVDEAMAPLNEALRRAAAVAVLAFLAATLGGLIAARYLTAPIVALRAATRELASGRYRDPLPRIRSGDELEDLAEDFRRMSNRLADSMDSLEDRAHELAELYETAEHQRALAAAVLDGTEEAIVFVAADQRLMLANRGVETLLGHPPETVLGRRFDELGEAVDRVFTQPDAFRALVGGTSADSDRVLSEVVSTRWPVARELALYSTPVRTPDRTFLGRLYVFRDVTREREVDRMKSEFVSLVSHELRTPLTSIKGYVDLLLEGDAGELGEEQAEFLKTVKSNADRLVALINDLLDVSRIEAGKVELRLGALDLGQVVREVAGSLRPQLEAKGQTLRLELPEDLPAVVADRDRVVQIVTNLLSNAHKYTPEGGELGVAAQPEGGMVRVDVRDNGIGLSEEEQAALFGKFFRARNATTEQVGGTGLGLAITRSLVELHGGKISVDSRSGQGSTFSFILPSTAVSIERGAAAAAVRRQGRILVIDDEPDIANLIRRYLERAGYVVLVASTAAGGLRIARDERPDLITLDLVLPDADGSTLLEWLRSNAATAAIPVVVLTVVPEDARNGLVGAAHYLTKPVDEQQLVDQVDRILAGVDGRAAS